jgi:hypothetical protein
VDQFHQRKSRAAVSCFRGVALANDVKLTIELELVQGRLMRVLGVAGSLRGDSHNRSLLRAAGSLFPRDVQFAEYERLKVIPPFDEETSPRPRSWSRFGAR